MNEPTEEGKTKEGRGCLTFGCGVMAFLFFLILLLGGRILYRSYVRYTEQYIGNMPERLPEVVYNADEAAGIRARLAEFVPTLDGTEHTFPVSANELNVLMRSSPEAAALSGILHFFTEKETLKAKLSLDLGPLGMQGRYLNGDATMQLLPDPHDPSFRVSSVDIGGERLPPRLTSIVQRVNFFAALNLSPEQGAVLRRLEEIKVSGKTIYLSFK